MNRQRIVDLLPLFSSGIAILWIVGVASSATAQTDSRAPAITPAVPDARPAAESPMAVPTPVANGKVHVLLDDGSQLFGTLDADLKILLKTHIGEALIPVKKLVSIEFLVGGRARIRFTNGDVLSGELKMAAIKLEVTWGEASIETEHVKSVVSLSHFTRQETVIRPVSETAPDGRVTTRFVELPDGAVPAASTGAPTVWRSPAAPPRLPYSLPTYAAPSATVPTGPSYPAPIPAPSVPPTRRRESAR